ncbi:MAG: cation:proton antiporter [Treponema sp.]
METYKILLELSILIITAKFFGVTAKKIGAPQVVGEIVAGLLIGPSCLNLVHADQFITYMSEIGVILLMFSAGLGTNLKSLVKSGFKATLIALVGVFVPLILGTIMSLCFWGFDGFGTKEFYKAMFIGTILTATSVSITVATLQELGKIKTDVGQAIVSAAIIDDVIGIVVLTIVLGVSTGTGGYFEVIAKTVGFFAFAIVVGYVTYRIFKWYDRRHPRTHRISVYGIGVAFLFAYLAERLFGIADITGAYVAGVVLCNLSDADYISQKVDVNSYMIFGPVFFASIGLKTTIQGMDMQLLWFSLAFVAVGLVAKIIGCGGIARVLGFNKKESIQIGVGMMTRGEVALIVAQKGLAVGMVDSKYFTSVILLIIVSSMLVPVCLKKLFSDGKKRKAGVLDVKQNIPLSAEPAISEQEKTEGKK